MTAAPEREIGNEISGALHDSTGGFELVIGALAAAGLGFLIDRAVGTTPLITIIFAVVGFIGATISIYYRYRATMDSADASRTARRTGEVAA